MRLHELLQESYEDKLISAVSDLMSIAITNDLKKISMKKFEEVLAKQGYPASVEEIIQAVDKSGFASSVNKVEIIPNTELGLDKDNNEPTVDVGGMAGNQAMSDIKSEL
jgi:transcriptional/translational regulatory protein YebC/TACO1